MSIHISCSRHPNCIGVPNWTEKSHEKVPPRICGCCNCLLLNADQPRCRTCARCAQNVFGTRRFRRFSFAAAIGNHLFVTTIMNGRRTALMIDTGSPRTLIDRGTIHSLGLAVQGTKIPVGGVWGWKPEHYGVSKLTTLMMGNCTFTNVPITVADESHINKVSGSYLDGLFGE